METETREAFENFAKLATGVMEQINTNMKIMFELLEKLEKQVDKRKGMEVVKPGRL